VVFFCITAVDIFIYFCVSALGFVIGIDLGQAIAGPDPLNDENLTRHPAAQPRQFGPDKGTFVV
jgi:hypothetical protein